MRKLQTVIGLVALLIFSYLISYFSLNTIKNQGYEFVFRAKKPYDCIIKYVNIIDGTGKETYLSDLGITDGKITYIGKLDSNKAEQVIDASGLTVLPKLVPWEYKGDVVEISLSSAFQQFSVDRIILTSLPTDLLQYKGLTLWEAALRMNKQPSEAVDMILYNNYSSKALVIPVNGILTDDLVSATHKITGFRADVMGESHHGRILLGYWADLMFYNIQDENHFLKSLKEEEMPIPYWQMDKGIINQ